MDRATRLELTAFVVLLVGFSISHVDWFASVQDRYQRADDARTVELALRVAGYLMVGLTGVLLSWRAAAYRWQEWNAEGAVLGAYLLLCAASLAWSDAPVLTLQRLVMLACYVAAAVGVARQFDAQRFGWLLVGLASGLLLLGVVAELSLGTFRPWEQGYRFAGTLHPNRQAGVCAVLALVGMLAPGRAYRPWFLVAGAVGATFVWLTDSRTGLLALAAGLAMVWAPPSRLLTRLGAALGLAAVVFVTLAPPSLRLVGAPRETESPAEMVDPGADAFVVPPDLRRTSGLNGRVALWRDLWPSLEARPWLGHGHGAFWTAERGAAVSAAHGWSIGAGHSAYLDVLLGVGVVGALPLAVWVGLSLLAALRATQRSTPGGRLALALLVLALVTSIAESHFVQTTFQTFAVLTAVLSLATAQRP